MDQPDLPEIPQTSSSDKHLLANPKFDRKARALLIVGLTALVAALLAAVWWINSPWFMRSSNLEAFSSTANATVDSAAEWKYFGVPIINNSAKKLMIEEVKFSTSKNQNYTFTVMPLEANAESDVQAGVGAEARIGVADLNMLQAKFGNQWAQRQSPRGVWIEPNQEVMLLVGLGVQNPNNYNHAGSIDVVFTDGKFRGTTSMNTDFQVEFKR